jgi:hypothetical protein
VRDVPESARSEQPAALFELQPSPFEPRKVARAVMLQPPTAAGVPVSSQPESCNALSTRRKLAPFTAPWRAGDSLPAATCSQRASCRWHRSCYSGTRSLKDHCWRHRPERKPQADDQQPQPLEDSPA